MQPRKFEITKASMISVRMGLFIVMKKGITSTSGAKLERVYTATKNRGI